MSISIRRLAHLAGVSHVTVVRALHGRDAVSEQTRQRILALARKHHFPLPVARPPTMTKLLNVLCSMIDTDTDETKAEHGFNRRLLAGVRRGAADCGAELTNFVLDADTWPLVVNRRQVDGVVIERGDGSDFGLPLPLPIPAVFLFGGPDDADVVTVANFDAGIALGRHLAALGHRRVGFLGPETAISRERLAGLRTGLEAAGGFAPPECVRVHVGAGARTRTATMTDDLLQAARSGPNGLPVVESPAADNVGFTALMAYNDYMAAAAVMRLIERGVRVPEDVSVVGFDSVRPDWYDGPALTTVAMPMEEIGAEAARLVYWRLAHPGAPHRRLVLSAPLVPGETTGAVGNAGPPQALGSYW